MKPPFSIREIAQQQLVDEYRESERVDGEELHVADLAKCTREVWARRHGEPRIEPSPDSLMKFRYGHMIEAELVRLVSPKLEAHGWEAVHGGEVSYTHNGITVVGHPDLRLYNHDEKKIIVFDCKSTTFYPTNEPDGFDSFGRKKYRKVRYAPDSPREHYQIQTNAYACIEAHDHPDYKVGYGVLVACRESGQLTDFSQLYAPDFDDLHALLVEYNALTGSEQVTAPPPEPPAFTFKKNGTTWACSYCAYGGCPLNVNPDALSLM